MQLHINTTDHKMYKGKMKCSTTVMSK